MGVYVTGDTHGNCQRIIEYAREHCLDAHDTIIVAGDFGCVWDGSVKEALTSATGCCSQRAVSHGVSEHLQNCLKGREPMLFLMNRDKIVLYGGNNNVQNIVSC